MKLRKQRLNANRHTERGLKLLSSSIPRDGWIGAQTAAADGELFDGSARQDVAGDTEPVVVHSDGSKPVVVIRDDIPTADDPKARRLGILANQIAVANWNPDTDIVEALAAEDEAVLGAFSCDELAKMLPASLTIDDDTGKEMHSGSVADIPELELQAFEHYDYLVLIFESTFDWQRACDIFGIGKARVTTTGDDGKFVSRIGLGRAIDGTKVLALVDK